MLDPMNTPTKTKTKTIHTQNVWRIQTCLLALLDPAKQTDSWI